MVGFLAAAVSGFLAVRFMMRFLKKHRMRPFAIYTLVVGVFVIVSAWRELSRGRGLISAVPRLAGGRRAALVGVLLAGGLGRAPLSGRAR